MKKKAALEALEKQSERKSKKNAMGIDELEKSKSNKKVKLGEEDVEVDNPNSVSKFQISVRLTEKLKEKGIEALLPIQATTFDTVFCGVDLVGRGGTTQISNRYLKPNKKTIDLDGNDKMKPSNSVRHIVLPCNKQAMSRLIPVIISCYSSGGRTIIFAETKDSASELSGLLPGSRALHGCIQQSQREVTLAEFRSGKFSTLVLATNVVVCDRDIDDVQLIIQCKPPHNVKAYIHLSGCTGIAGNTRVAVMLYDLRESNISKIEQEAGIKFEHVSPPQPDDIARAVGMEAAEKITQVCDSVVSPFMAAAKELLETSSLSAEELLAKVLAKTAGFTEVKKRSLLTSMENRVTLHLEAGKRICTPSYAYGMLRTFVLDDMVESIECLTLTANETGAVFDVVQSDVDLFIAAARMKSVSLEVVKELPKLK